jgi:hypothetical protein
MSSSQDAHLTGQGQSQDSQRPEPIHTFQTMATARVCGGLAGADTLLQ